MPRQHGVRAQKRLAKKNLKRRAKQRELARKNSSDPTIRLKTADRWPVAVALVPEELWEIGLGNLMFARRMPDGMLACALFLVDVFCLGVKDAMWRILPPAEFRTIREKIESRGRLEEVAPEHFAKLVYQAADYGQSLGFPPHRDFRHAIRLLVGIDPSQCVDEFCFGQDGRPMYIPGPSESLERVRLISQRVAEAGGHFSIPLSLTELPDDFELELLEEDDETYEQDSADDELDQLEECAKPQPWEESDEQMDEEDEQPRSKLHSWLRIPWFR